LRPFIHGFWSGGAYTDDRTGVFSHCSAGVAYDSGINLFILVTGSHRWWLGFIDPQWSLPANSKASVQLRLDNRAPFKRFATIPSGQLALVPLPDSPRLIHAFRRASKLTLVAEGGSFFFKLRETSAVMDQLTSCVGASLALEAHGPPAGTAGAASPPSPIAAVATEAPPPPPGQIAAASVTPRPPAETASAVSAWVSLIALGALMGVVGQGIRVIVGLKKARDELAALGHLNEAGKPFSAVSVMNLLGQRSGKLPGVGSRAATQLPQAAT